MAHSPSRFKTDLRDLRFVLFEQHRLDELLDVGALGRDEAEMCLTEVERLAREVIGPLNTPGDRAGCRLENGQVVVPPGFKEAWKQTFDAGWYQLTAPEAWGGQDAPGTMHMALTEMICGANASFSMYPGLTYGVAEVIHACGTRDQQQRHLPQLFGGLWAGTMCLTEPHAGSDVGSARTSARRLGEGRYAIRGTKIFISAGDHDLTDNIIHLVLARVEGAPAGTKGLSLFMVPKYRVNADGSRGEPNDVSVGSIEHKMGLNGSATAVLNFGENDACIGELVGTEENVGMGQMFRLMNGARIAVALQGVGVATSAYLNALEYARERKQGAHVTQWKDPAAPRVPIVEHPDVRRMLLDMKARVEGIRSLVYKLAVHRDRGVAIGGKDDQKAAYHQGQVDLFTPIIKSYASDQAFRICEMAIQTYGGAGYLKDHPVEQYCRDSKVFSIYEGTNHIQAMDLVGRKLGQQGGAAFRAFLGDVSTFVAAHGKHPTLAGEVVTLGKCADTLGASAMQLLGWFQSGRVALVPLHANRFLEMMAETATAWMLLDQARIAAEKNVAADHPDHAFYAGKLHAARYYVRTVLPHVIADAKVLQSEDQSPLDAPF